MQQCCKTRILKSARAPVTLAALARSALVGGVISPAFLSALQHVDAEASAAPATVCPNHQLHAQGWGEDVWNRLFRRLPMFTTRQNERRQPRSQTASNRSQGRRIPRLFRILTHDERVEQNKEKLYNIFEGTRVDKSTLDMYLSNGGGVELHLEDVALPHWKRSAGHDSLLASRLTDDLSELRGPDRVKAVKIIFNKTFLPLSKRRTLLTLPNASDVKQVLNGIATFDRNFGLAQEIRDKLMAVYPLGSEKIAEACRNRLRYLMVNHLYVPKDRVYMDENTLKGSDLDVVVEQIATKSSLGPCAKVIMLGTPPQQADILRLIAIGYKRLKPAKVEELCGKLMTSRS